MVDATSVKNALQAYARPHDVTLLQRFFKTGKGEYGEGDVFIGVRVPNIRQVCKQNISISLGEVQQLLRSHVHEHRLAAVILLTYQYPRVNTKGQEAIFNMYVKNVRLGTINNWDIIDISADKIVGAYLLDTRTSLKLLYDLAGSTNLWQRRVAIMASFWFIKHGDPEPTLRLAALLQNDTHDLIHKATGWMLREVGKRIDTKILQEYLQVNAHNMPRTMLRYAIERLPSDQKNYYMQRRST